MSRNQNSRESNFEHSVFEKEIFNENGENFIIEKFKNDLKINGVFHISNSELNFENTLRQKLKEFKQKGKDLKKDKRKIQGLNIEETVYMDLNKNKQFFENISYEENPELKSLYSVCSAFNSQKTYSNHFNIRRTAVYDILQKEKKYLKTKDVLYDSEKIGIVEVKKLSDYFSKISKLFERQINLFFRGQANLNWRIQPGIVRNNPESEQEYFNEILRRYPEEFKEEVTFCEKLSRMQHFGIPTRLLDITENPYIALYFACESNFGDSGEVRIYSAEEKMKIKNYDDIELNKTLGNCLKSKSDVSKENFILRGKYSNRRIRNQKGLFVFCGDISESSSVEDLEYKYENKNKCFKKTVFVVNGNEKESILKELERLGITEEFVYPDIENSASYLKKKFGNPMA